MTKTIGILAGMGPRSTAPFVDELIDKCQFKHGIREDYDFPHMMIYTLPIPFYMDRPLDHQAMAAIIGGGLERLAACGVDFIAMPCNTAHLYFEELAKRCPVPLLNMVEIAVNALPQAVSKVAVFATRPTTDGGLYHPYLEQAGKQVVTDPSWQDRVDALLANIKTGMDSVGAGQQWHALQADAAAAGAEIALLGCTDLNAVPALGHAPLEMLDATEILAEVTIQRWVADGP